MPMPMPMPALPFLFLLSCLPPLLISQPNSLSLLSRLGQHALFATLIIDVLLHDSAIEDGPLGQLLDLAHLDLLVRRGRHDRRARLLHELLQDRVRVPVLHVDGDDALPFPGRRRRALPRRARVRLLRQRRRHHRRCCRLTALCRGGRSCCCCYCCALPEVDRHRGRTGLVLGSVHEHRDRGVPELQSW